MLPKTASRSVAIIFDDLTEFFVMRPAIDAMEELKINVDIIVPHDSGYNGLAEHTIKKIQKFGFNALNDVPKDKHYQILLTPYPGLEAVKRANFRYHLQYPYGPISSKPNPTHAPGYRIEYDALLIFNTYNAECLSACGSKVYVLPYWRYHNFQKQTHSPHKKPTLLFLPTFGPDTGCIKDLNEAAITNIKKHFYVITKAHHAIHFQEEEKDNFEKLKSFADESYDSDTPVDELLKKANLVLSDNSGAIFEAVAAGVPVALFANDLNSRHLGKINTPQYDFTEQGFFPYANNPDDLLTILLSTKKYSKKQQELRKQIFLEYSENPIKPFIDIIKHYLDSDPKKDRRKILHDLLVDEWESHKQKILAQEREINQLKSLVEDIHNSTSWKITEPLRKIKFWSK